MSIHDDLMYQVEQIRNELFAIYDGNAVNEEGEEASIYDWISDQLDVEYVLDSNRQLIGTHIYCTLGGPTVYVDTRRGEIVGNWGTDHVTRWLPSEYCEMINEAFEELFDC